MRNTPARARARAAETALLDSIQAQPKAATRNTLAALISLGRGDAAETADA